MEAKLICQKYTEISPASVLRQIGHVRGSTILSEDILTSKYRWQPGQHISLQHLLINSAIHFYSSFNKHQGWFQTIRSNSSSNHDTSQFLSLEMCSDTFRDVSWWSSVNHIILVVDHSLHIESLLIWPNKDCITHCISNIIFPLLGDTWEQLLSLNLVWF